MADFGSSTRKPWSLSLLSHACTLAGEKRRAVFDLSPTIANVCTRACTHAGRRARLAGCSGGAPLLTPRAPPLWPCPRCILGSARHGVLPLTLDHKASDAAERDRVIKVRRGLGNGHGSCLMGETPSAKICLLQ